MTTQVCHLVLPVTSAEFSRNPCFDTYIVEPNGYPFVPFSVESYGRLCQPAMKLLHPLGDEAAGPDGVQRASFVAGA
jgi:hypothetical protein